MPVILVVAKGPLSSHRPAMQNVLCYTRYCIVQKSSNKQSAKVICRFDRLRTALKKPYENGILIA